VGFILRFDSVFDSDLLRSKKDMTI